MNISSTSTSAVRAAAGAAQLRQSLAVQRQLQELQSIDMRVRAHEAAHLAAGGGLVTGGASFSYQTGPDGKQYAVGGEVSIDTSAEDNPEATIAKMQQVRRAALAPANPSSTDRSVAAAAAAREAAARLEQFTGSPTEETPPMYIDIRA